MRARNEWENELPGDLTGAESQRLFERMFPDGYKPKTDTRTPKAVESGLSPEEWRELNG